MAVALHYARLVHAGAYTSRQQQPLPEHEGQYFGTRSTPWTGPSWWPQWIRQEVKMVTGTAL